MCLKPLHLHVGKDAFERDNFDLSECEVVNGLCSPVALQSVCPAVSSTHLQLIAGDSPS